MRTRRAVAMALAAGLTLITAAAADQPVIEVRAIGTGTYQATARLLVGATPAVARGVITDYANMSRFIPNLRTSRIVHRDGDLLYLEQESFSRYAVFSKRVHLLLEIDEGDDVIRFRDVCKTDFVRYEGSWTMAATAAGTELRYELTAEPAFSVPSFVLRRLLDRDARTMLKRLEAEIHARSETAR